MQWTSSPAPAVSGHQTRVLCSIQAPGKRQIEAAWGTVTDLTQCMMVTPGVHGS